MTDSGFWDIEHNSTNDITYSYSGRKSYSRFPPTYEWVVEQRKDRTDKLVLPVQDRSSRFVNPIDSIFVEYDKKWVKDPNDTNPDKDKRRYRCQMSSPSDQSLLDATYPYAMVTSVENTTTSTPTYDDIWHEFVGGIQSFGLYNGHDDGTMGSVSDNAHIMVNFNDSRYGDLFRRLLFSNSTLVNPFISWLYEQCVTPDREKHYLKVRHHDFATYVNANAKGDDIVKYSGMEYQMGNSDSIVIDDKFKSIKNLVKAWNGSASTLYDYCDTLKQIVNQNDSQLKSWVFNDA